VSPTRRREAARYLMRRFKVSERRACSLIGQHRSTQRYEGVPGDFEVRLIKAMHVHADAHPRWGYRRIHALLVADGWEVNVKRVHRLWVLEELRLPPRRRSGQKSLGTGENSAWNLPAVRLGHVWSYDFVAARLRNGGPLRILNVVDEYSRVCVGAHVARNIGSRDVVKFLTTLFDSLGPPEVIRSDNGKEFTAATVTDWLGTRGVTAAFIEKASPQQNCYVERFNGTMRDELLNGELFHSITEARVVITDWIGTYNNDRPHRGLAMKTPAGFAREARMELTAHSRKVSK
jgi:putative transposase